MRLGGKQLSRDDAVELERSQLEPACEHIPKHDEPRDAFERRALDRRLMGVKRTRRVDALAQAEKRLRRTDDADRMSTGRGGATGYCLLPPCSTWTGAASSLVPEAELSVGHVANAPASTSEEAHQCLSPGSVCVADSETELSVVENLRTQHVRIQNGNSEGYCKPVLTQPARRTIQRADRASEMRALESFLARGRRVD